MDTALVTANVALVLVTLAYAIPTWRMVNELRRTRLLTILPRVTLDVKHMGAGLAFITVGNFGKGPALDVRATLTFEGLADARKISFHTLSEGERHSFMTPRNASNELMRMDELTADVSASFLWARCRTRLEINTRSMRAFPWPRLGSS